MKTTMKLLCAFLLPLIAFCVIYPSPSVAHGERAQMPQLRMRTVHWIDVEASTTKLAVNEIVKISGKFMPSKYWPHHVDSIEDTAYLNIGVPGPSFVRLDSRVNGVPMIRSTSANSRASAASSSYPMSVA